MKKILLAIFAVSLLASPAARAQDSMAWFRSLIENARPEAADMGGWVAPEIYSVDLFPIRPAAGDTPVVRAMVGSWSAMVSYTIVSVDLTWWKTGGEMTTVPMKRIDDALGIYEATLPRVATGDEVFYTVRAVDSWGNAALEIPPMSDRQIFMTDTQDASLDPALDVRDLSAAAGGGKLTLCMELTGKPGRNLGSDILAYGIIAFDRDVRYKPSQTETELTSGWLAAHVPAFSVSDILRATDLAGALQPTPGPKKSEFKKKDNLLCWRFDPAVIRADYETGIKVVGASLAVDASSMALKISDTTHTAMLYPKVHSFKVF